MTETPEVYVYQPSELDNINIAQAALARVTTPEQSKEIETIASVAKAYYKEQGDYEGVVKAEIVYIQARRKTTELSIPFAPKPGGDRGGNQYAKWQKSESEDLPFAFTQSQWTQRMKEYRVTEQIMMEYFDNCIERHVEPTIYGMLVHAGDPFAVQEGRLFKADVVAALKALVAVFEEEMKMRYGYTKAEQFKAARPHYYRAWRNARTMIDGNTGEIIKEKP